MTPETSIPLHNTSPAQASAAADILLPFKPTEAQSARLIDAFIDPTLSLCGLAEEFNTTIDALTLYLARPEVMQRLTSFETIAAFHIRLVAANHLHVVVGNLRQSIAAATAQASDTSLDDGSPQARELIRRRSETARRGCALLLRLAQFTPLPIDHRAAPRPTPSPRPSTVAPSPMRPAATAINSDVQTFVPPAPTNTARPVAPTPYQSPTPLPPAQSIPDTLQAMPQQTSNNIAHLTAAAGRNAAPHHSLNSGSQPAISVRDQLLPVPAS